MSTPTIKDHANVPAGPQFALLVGVIDLGIHEKNYQGKITAKRLVMLQFETPQHKTAKGYPAVVKATLPVTTYEKGSIIPYLKALGVEYTETDTNEEIITKLGEKLGVKGPVTIVVTVDEFTTKDRETGEDITLRYNNIENIIKSDKTGLEVPDPVSRLLFFCQGVHEDSLANDLPEFIKNRIKFISASLPKEDTDDLPFK